MKKILFQILILLFFFFQSWGWSKGISLKSFLEPFSIHTQPNFIKKQKGEDRKKPLSHNFSKSKLEKCLPLRGLNHDRNPNRFIEISGLSSPDTVCVGSIGDAIVNITFGSGSKFGPALGPGITNLQFVNQDCPNDGQYTITNNTPPCFGDSWHATRDHTGDPNGYFMLINASFQPNDFYVQKVSNLCSGTTFEFSSWIINMVTSRFNALILPNITFSIEKEDGTILKTYNTGPLPEYPDPNWVKYGFYFTTPPGITTVVLRLRNNAPGGNGNDLGLDDITFRPVGPLLNSKVEGFSSDSIIVCKGSVDSIRLNAGLETCSLPTNFQWQKSVHTDTAWNDIPKAIGSSYSYKIKDTGLVFFRIAAAQDGNINNPNCRFLSKVIKVGVYNNTPTSIGVKASRDSICTGDTVNFTAIPVNPGSKPHFQWYINGQNRGSDSIEFKTSNLRDQDQIKCVLQSSIPCSSTSISNTIIIHSSNPPIVNLPKAYFLVGSKSVQLDPQIIGAAYHYEWTPSAGLSNPNIPNPVASPLSNTSYQLRVETLTGCSVIANTQLYLIYNLDIPNIFSPNHDGINDTWNIKHLADFTNCSVTIFNRYGQKVFYSEGYTNPWDGTLNGSPLPLATYYYIIDLKNGYKVLSGSITLVR